MLTVLTKLLVMIGDPTQVELNADSTDQARLHPQTFPLHFRGAPVLTDLIQGFLRNPTHVHIVLTRGAHFHFLYRPLTLREDRSACQEKPQAFVYSVKPASKPTEQLPSTAVKQNCQKEKVMQSHSLVLL